MNQHTPGPWRTEHSKWEDGDAYRLIGSREEHLGELYGAHRAGEHGQYHANAALIAAAPELLETLSAAVKGVQSSFPLGAKAKWLRQAATAIARAKGETK